jgi:hypothetical protein
MRVGNCLALNPFRLVIQHWQKPVKAQVSKARAVLLANHRTVVSGDNLLDARVQSDRV